MKRISNLAVSAALVLATAGSSVFAAGTAPDFSSLTSAVDFSTVGTAVLAIAALIAVPLVVMKGARMVLGMIRR